MEFRCLPKETNPRLPGIGRRPNINQWCRPGSWSWNPPKRKGRHRLLLLAPLLVFTVINRPGVDSKDRRLSSQCSKWRGGLWPCGGRLYSFVVFNADGWPVSLMNRLSAFLTACKRVGSRNPSLQISCRTAVSAAPLCACEIGPTTLETNVTRHGIVVSSQQTSQQRQQSQMMGWRYEGTSTTAWTQPALDRSLILWVGVPSSASRPLLPVSRAVKKYRAARYSQPRSGNQPIMG